MNKEAIGFVLVALLFGGIVLFARRRALTSHYSAPHQGYTTPNIRLVPVQEEPKRYKNKETRRIEYNDDGLPTLIEITRDYAIT